MLIVVTMATMFDHDDTLSTMIAPATIVVWVAMHFYTHAATFVVTVAMHFAPVPVTVISVTANSDAHLRVSLDREQGFQRIVSNDFGGS